MRPAAAAALLLLLAAGLAAAGVHAAAATMPAVCTEEPGCKCNRTAFGFWVQVSCACTPGQDLLEIKSEQLPSELVNFEISRCKEVRLLPGSLTQQKALRKIHAHDIEILILKKNSFLNASATNSLLHIENCSTVVIESSTYKNTLSPQSIVLEKSKHVVIQPSAFSWIQDIHFKDVSRLELHKNAFSQSGAAVGHHGPATKVLIEDSKIPEIPGLAFPLSAADLRIQRSVINVIRRDAFCGLLVLNLSLIQCKLETFERGAFSARTLVHRLSLSNLTVEKVDSNAVQSAVANFTLQHSKLKEVLPGGINVTAATVVLLNNVLDRLHSKGLSFSQWDRLDIQNNAFKNIGFSGVWAPTERSDGAVVFAENVIGNMTPEKGVLYFGISPRENSLDIQVQDNRFERLCTCNQWLKEEVSPRRGEVLPSDYAHRWTDFWVEAFHNSSLCVVSDLIAKCFGSNTTMGFMRSSSFWDSVCIARTVIRCQNGDLVDIPTLPRPESPLDKVALIIMVFVIVCIIVLVLINVSIQWYKRYPENRLSVSKVFPCLKRTEAADNETPTLPMGTVVSNSIDLLPGPRKQKRKKRHKRRNVGVTASEDNTLIIDEVMPGSTNCSEAGTVRTHASTTTMESTILVVDSGTQTVGTGTLVDDILSDLKEKLKDPTHYGDARDLIENIYNQITIESTQRPAQPTEREENFYAEIQPCTSYQTPAVCEYGEPKDRRTNIYTEPQTRLGRLYQFIRGGPQNNDVEARPTAVTEYQEPSDTKIHLYTELQQPSKMPNMANRPLPRTPEELTSEEDSESDESS